MRITSDPPRPPGPGEVIVRVRGCALGREPGAEICGEIVATGEAAAELQGKRVVVPRLLPCGECERCRRGHAASCPSRAPRRGLAREETVPARFLVALDGDPPLWPFGWDELWRAAALADAASAPYSALARAGLGPGDIVLVLGDGPRAALARAIVVAKGARSIGVDPSQAPEEAALEDAPTIILESTGRSAARHRALAMLPPGATAVFLDGPDDAVPVPPPDWARFSAGENRLLGAEAAHPDLLPEVCALAARGELPLREVTVARGADELEATLAQIREGKLPQLAIVCF
jgi:6-hydroxycyclohex-1-ene-1-carbonyl-CoA dehydrogenase